MTKIRILPLRSVVIYDQLATEGTEVEVAPDTAASLIADAAAEPASVLTPLPAPED